MKIKSTANERNTERYKVILSLRREKKAITEIAKILNISKQGVSYYLVRYGDIDKFEK